MRHTRVTCRTLLAVVLLVPLARNDTSSAAMSLLLLPTPFRALTTVGMSSSMDSVATKSISLQESYGLACNTKMANCKIADSVTTGAIKAQQQTALSYSMPVSLSKMGLALYSDHQIPGRWIKVPLQQAGTGLQETLNCMLHCRATHCSITSSSRYAHQ